MALKELLQISPESPLTDEQATSAVDELRDACYRLKEQFGAHGIALVVLGEPQADGQAHVFDASTVDYMPLSILYGTVAGGHARYEHNQREVEKGIANRKGLN